MRDIYVPQAGDMINALKAGRQDLMASQKDEATRKAGGLMASGDYKGAAAALYPYDIAAGAKVDEMGRAFDAQGRKVAYGRQVASGQGKQAVKDAYGAGDFELAGDIQTQLDKLDKAGLERTAQINDIYGQAAAAALELPKDDRAGRLAVIQRFAPSLAQFGVQTGDLSNFDTSDDALNAYLIQAMGVEKYLTARRQRETLEETKRANKAREANAAYTAQTGRMSFEERKRQRGFGTPGYGDDDLSGLSTAELLAAAGLPPAKQ